MTAEVLTVSSKGQVVLPAPMRRELSISSGDKLVAYASGDAILLKPLELPCESDLERWLGEMRSLAFDSGLTEADVVQAVSEVRVEDKLPFAPSAGKTSQRA